MTRWVASPLFILATVLWSAAVRAAPDTSSAMPIQVAGTTLGTEADTQLQAESQVQPQTRSKAGAVAGVFAPAPMPDPDVDPPSGGAARGASLTPALFSHKEEFAGDGFAAASDADHGLDHRRAPAAGLNWSVPVK